MKWVLRIGGVLAAVVAVVFIIGLALPQNHVATRTARFASPPEVVWEAITRVEHYPSWRKDVDSVQLLTGQSDTLAWREVSGGDRIAFVAEVAEAPSLLVTRISDKSLPFGGSWEYRIDRDGTGSKLTITENGEVYNPIFRFASRYVIGHTATIDNYLKQLAARLGETIVPALADSGRG
jgi:uncharacterized protein YndB with AHSA1/START domain